MVEGSICPCSSKPSAFNNIPIILLLGLGGRGLAQRSGLAPPATVPAEAEQSENVDGRSDTVPVTFIKRREKSLQIPVVADPEASRLSLPFLSSRSSPQTTFWCRTSGLRMFTADPQAS